MARGVATVLLCPITVIKTRMQYTGRPYRSVLHAIITIARTEGMPGLFKYRKSLLFDLLTVAI